VCNIEAAVENDRRKWNLAVVVTHDDEKGTTPVWCLPSGGKKTVPSVYRPRTLVSLPVEDVRQALLKAGRLPQVRRQA
jgi:hypothetical protein